MSLMMLVRQVGTVTLCILHNCGVYTLTAAHPTGGVLKPKFEIVASLTEKPPVVYRNDQR
jgi:hypothetical protein